MSYPTQEYLRTFLHYNPDTGCFTWKKRPSNNVKVGAATGTLCSNGYVQIRVQKRLRMAHILAWLYVHGQMPRGQIDHINGDKADNRIANLRDVAIFENCQNRPKRRDNNSGYVGVSWSSREAKWRSRITVEGKVIGLGYYGTKEEAAHAYALAKAKLHIPGANVT